MILLVPLLSGGLVALIGTRLLARGLPALHPWSGAPAAAGCGMAAVYLSAGLAHFLEPQRSGLAAIVPAWAPEPALVVALSGLAELLLAAGLLTPRLRRPVGWCSAGFLLLVLPANIVATEGVEHPAAPDTPLLPRLLLQLVFIACSLLAARPTPPAPGRGAPPRP